MTSAVKDTLRFLRQYATTPGTTGAVAPSSRALAESICTAVDLANAQNIVEFGPGTGAFTKVILEKTKPQAEFFVIEHSQSFIDILKPRHPDLKIFHDTAENVRAICDAENIDKIDCIISGLPFAAFPDDLQRSLLDGIISVLKPGGQFATFGYWTGRYLKAGRRFRATLDEYFPTINQLPTVWQNLPPAFVYQCTTGSDDAPSA